MLKWLGAGEQHLLPDEQRSFRSYNVFAQNAPRYLRRRSGGCDLWAALGESMRLSEYYRAEIETSLGACTAPAAFAERLARPDARLSFLLERQRQASLLLDAHVACLNDDIARPAYDMLCRVLNHQPAGQWAGQAVRVSHLSMLGHALEGALLLAAEDALSEETRACVVYLPNEPDCPFREHASMAALSLWLAQKIDGDTDYRHVIARRVDYRRVPEFIPALLEQAREHSRGGAHWAFTTRPAGRELFSELVRLQIDKLLAEAGSQVVPVDSGERTTGSAPRQGWEGLGLSTGQRALYDPPGPGRLAQAARSQGLLDLFYEGWRDWQPRNRHEMVGSMMAQVIELLELEPGQREQVFRERGEPRVSAFSEGLIVIMDRQRVLRLWNPDPRVYEQRREPPELDEPDAQGIFHDGDACYVRIDARLYRLDPQAFDGRRRLLHPTCPDAYGPLLLHNGEGAWRFAFEQPGKWSDELYLFRRLGPIAEGLCDSSIRQLLKVTNTHAALLRRLHIELLPVPGVLRESIQRWRRHKMLLDVEAVTVAAVTQAPRRFFPELPLPVEQELMADACDRQRRRLVTDEHIPLSLSEAARGCQLELAVNRVIGDLFLNAPATFETDRLAFHLLEHLPGWPDSLRVELRYERKDGGQPQTFVLGPESAALAWRLSASEQHRDEYRVLGALDNKPTASAGSLMQAVLLALLPEQRSALGFDSSQPGALREALAELAAKQRRLVARLQAAGPLALPEPPQGYPLWEPTGEDRQWQGLSNRVSRLYPLLSATQISLYLQSAGTLEQADRQLATRERECEQLRSQLLFWVESADDSSDRAASRRQLAYSIKRAWEQGGWQHAGETRRVTLDMQGMHVGRLPELHWQIDFSHVSELIGRDMALTDADQAFFTGFTGLRRLDLSDNRLTALPDALSEMPHLTRLCLQGNRIGLDAPGVALLAQMSALECLNLNDNPLGQVPDLSGLPALRQLMLRATGIDRWPVGLFPRSSLEALDLRDNRLTQLPTGLFDVPAVLTRHIGLQNNPWSVESLGQLAGLRQNPGVSLGVLPFPPRGGEQAQEDAWIEPYAPAALTTLGSHAPLSAPRTNWRRLRAEPMADGFFMLLWRLHLWAQELDVATQEDTARRVAALVEACVNHGTLREAVFLYTDGPRGCTETLETQLVDLEQLVATTSF
ncbi:dermonecrotic toxin domain-containing protein [Pseudomonas gingeri]